jgi:hypothetical protein
VNRLTDTVSLKMTDRETRRQLWREWISSDVPQVEAERNARVTEQNARGTEQNARGTEQNARGTEHSIRTTERDAKVIERQTAEDRSAQKVVVAREVARESDSAQNEEFPWFGPALSTPANQAQQLVECIREKLVGCDLSWDHRTEILTRARELSISRFEASLIIAAVQNRARESQPVDMPACEQPVRPTRQILRLIALVVALEVITISALMAL